MKHWGWLGSWWGKAEFEARDPKYETSLGGIVTRSLGLDVGDRRIGVALSDPMGILATPLTILERRGDDEDISSIIGLIKRHGVSQIVAGLPRSMSGGIGIQAEKVQSFVEKLSTRIKVPVITRDERLTSVLARRLIQDAATKKTKIKTRDDAIAAALILQGYLDEKGL